MNARPRAALWVAASLLSACSGAERRSSLPSPPSLPSPAVALPAAVPPAAKGDALAAAIFEGPPVDTRPRIASIGEFSYIYKRPEAKGLALGYVRMGTSVPLRSRDPVPGKGCARGWYAVEPRGYVCLGTSTTLDLDDPYYLALASVAPREDTPYRYAFSNGAPMYSRVPTTEESAKEDRKFGPRGAYVQLAEWSRGHEELLSDDPIQATDAVPEIFAGGKRHVGGGVRSTRRLHWRTIPNGSMLSYSRAFAANGRVWLLTPDLMLVPADRVRAIRGSSFHGVKLDGTVTLPLAWNRSRSAKPRYRRQGDQFIAMAESIPPKSFVAVSEEQVKIGDRAYHAVRGEPDVYVDAADVTLSRARKSLPRGVEPGQKWIEAKILPGTLTAYEGDRPVYATLFSPGKGGVPVPGHDNAKYSTTAIGIFPIEWKDRIATMTPDKGEPKVLWFSDVPHIQYLRAPLALHVAYWHEDFGNPKSAECVNVSPEDGRFLFGWTDPQLPEGWGGMRPGDGNGKSTPVVVTAR